MITRMWRKSTNALSSIDPKISIATVYRTMRLYEDADIIKTIAISVTVVHAMKKTATTSIITII